jgi:hypothetical protein
MDMNLNPYKIHRSAKGRHIDILEQSFIQKYPREHIYIDSGKLQGENNPLFTLLYDARLLHAIT